MLLQFGVENYLSIRDRQELSLIASSLKDNQRGLITCDPAPAGRILPSVVIYGANASGKSNLVSALTFMRLAVLYSHSQGKPGAEVPRRPFSLDPAYKEKSSIFDIDFVVEGIRYHYGFQASDTNFVAEWLYHYPLGRRQLLFERENEEFKFGRSLKGRNRIISDLTRDNSLFLSAAYQNDHEQLSQVARYFELIHSDTVISVESAYATARFSENDVDERVIRFLEKIGTGVVDYRRTEKDLSDAERTMQRDIFSLIEKMTNEPVDFEIPDKNVRIELGHRGQDGEVIFFQLGRESAGTRRLLVLLGEIFDAIDKGALLLVDELDASLHTQACEALLSLFSTQEFNPKGAQLVATTHDTNLLASPLLRRDQVWFTEKDKTGSTHLYPLTDIRTRKYDNIEKGYLQGRFGAVPVAGKLSEPVDMS